MLALVNQRPQLLNIYQDSRTHDEHISGSTCTYTRYAVINQDWEDMGHVCGCVGYNNKYTGRIVLVIFQDTPERHKRFGQWNWYICNYCDLLCRAAIYLPRGGFHICSKANLQKIHLPSHKLIKSTQTDWTQFWEEMLLSFMRRSFLFWQIVFLGERRILELEVKRGIFRQTL